MTDMTGGGKGQIQAGADLIAAAARGVAACFALFHLYTGFFGLLPGMHQRIVHLAFALTLVFLSSATARQRTVWRLLDLALAAAALAAMTYAYFEAPEALGPRAGIVLTGDIVAGCVTLALLLEATRRLMGWGLPIICVAFLAYAFLGQAMPGVLGHRGYGLERVVQQLFLSNEGFFGLPLGISANYILLFILFGAILNATSAGKFFIDLAFGLFGSARGGPAKMAIAASSLFGTISGSSVANTVSTGTFTIPLMKRVGLAPKTAGAVEAVASTGGQVMPPIMGAAAFLIAEILGIAYVGVIAAALIPAVLYFVSLFLMVDFEARRLRISGLPKAELPSVRRTLKDGWHLLLSPVILVYLLGVEQHSPLFAVTWSIAAALVVSFLRSGSRPSVSGLSRALQDGAMGGVLIAVACACAGIVIAMFSLTGLGFKASSALINFAQGDLFMLLVLSMVASLILGMGLPTVPAYLMLAVLVAPALIKLGVEPIAAHLFIFYFGVVSSITPPLALAAYAGASIAGSKPLGTAVEATRVGIAAFIIPYLFVYKPELVLIGSWASIALVVVESAAAVVGFVAALQGYLLGPLGPMQRLAALAGSILAVSPGIVPTAGGILLIVAAVLWARLTRKTWTEAPMVGALAAESPQRRKAE